MWGVGQKGQPTLVWGHCGASVTISWPNVSAGSSSPTCYHTVRRLRSGPCWTKSSMPQVSLLRPPGATDQHGDQKPPRGWAGGHEPASTAAVPAGELAWDAAETLAQLEKVLHLYRSGQYLHDLSQPRSHGECSRGSQCPVYIGSVAPSWAQSHSSVSQAL